MILEVLSDTRQVVEGLYPDLLQVVLVTFGRRKSVEELGREMRTLPIPESISSWGVLMAPPLRIISSEINYFRNISKYF